jgi:hypothetical protein
MHAAVRDGTGCGRSGPRDGADRIRMELPDVALRTLQGIRGGGTVGSRTQSTARLGRYGPSDHHIVGVDVASRRNKQRKVSQTLSKIGRILSKSHALAHHLTTATSDDVVIDTASLNLTGLR